MAITAVHLRNESPPTSSPGRWNLLRRWPTALAIGPWVLGLGGGEAVAEIEGFGEAMLLLPLPYVIGATLQRRRLASWPVLAAGIAVITALRIWDVVAPATVLVGVALVLLAWSTVSGHRHRSTLVGVQVLGLVGFGALALAGLAVDPDLGRYLVATGWLLHGVWDLVHLRLDRVVVRSYAEWCGVYDILVAAQLFLLV